MDERDVKIIALERLSTMENVTYRKMKIEECEKINDINPAQYIGKAWRPVDGERRLIEINYQDMDWPNGYEHHYNNLIKTIQEDGAAIGAFDKNNRLFGFGTLNRNLFGTKHKYVLLDQLFISLEHRGKGLGKEIFALLSDEAKEWGVEKIYICAGSAEETIAFYFRIGCTEAQELNMALYEADPRDMQLEFVI